MLYVLISCIADRPTFDTTVFSLMTGMIRSISSLSIRATCHGCFWERELFHFDAEHIPAGTWGFNLSAINLHDNRHAVYPDH